MRLFIIFMFTFVICTIAIVQNNNNFISKNTEIAKKLNKDFKKLNTNSPCKESEQACINDQFAQCVNKKFQLFPCNNGLICVVLPLINKSGVTITCDTNYDSNNRLKEAREK